MNTNTLSADQTNTLAVPIIVVKDINAGQKIEFLDAEWHIYSFDPFDLFFARSWDARNSYSDIFVSVQNRAEDRNATKFTIRSHRTNVQEIRDGKTEEFKIFVTISDGDAEKEFNLGKLRNPEEIQNFLQQQNISQIPGIEQYGLQGIQSGEDDEGYEQLFNVGFGGGTHNIHATLQGFAKTRKYSYIQTVTPEGTDPKKNHASRTSLFLQTKDGAKICLRTDTPEEKLTQLQTATERVQVEVGHILITDQHDNFRGSDKIGLHSVPTDFDRNVFHDVLTVVFNCEEKEAGKVIHAVIRELEEGLSQEGLSLEKKTTLDQHLQDLRYLQKEIKNINNEINIQKTRIQQKKNLCKEMQEIETYDSDKIGTEQGKIIPLEKKLKEYSDERILLLQKTLSNLIRITKCMKTAQNEHLIQQGEMGLWRISLVTNGEHGSVGFVETNAHSIFFTNGILGDGEKERNLLTKLKSLSQGYIDPDVLDATGCGDSSTAASLMVREKEGLQERRNHYRNILDSLDVQDQHVRKKAMAILESYFLSHLQKTISGVVYHCKVSNLWDIPNSKRVASRILKFVMDDTLEFAESPSWMVAFLYGDNTSIRPDRAYDGFNIYDITNGLDKAKES